MKIGPDYHRLKTMVKRSIEQNLRIKNFEARNGNYERNAVVKNQGTEQREQRTPGDCWQWNANGQCSKGDICSFRHDIISVQNRHSRILLRALLRGRMRKMHREPKAPEAEVPVEECFDCPARITSKEPAPVHSGKKWHPPECLFYKWENGCRFGEKCSYVHRQVKTSLAKGLKTNVTKVQWLCSRREIGKKENLLPTKVTIDQGNLIREVIKSWNEDLLNVDHLMHDNWVAYFKT